MAVAAAVAAFAAAAQSDFAPVARDDSERQVVDKIAVEQAEHGPYSPLLIESWMDLARLYRDGGDRARELGAIGQALQVSHATYGLRSLEQVPLLQQLVRSHAELGDAQGAWDLEGDLLELAKEHPRDPRAASIWAEIADRRGQALARYGSGEKPPELFLGCYYGADSCHAGSRSMAMSGWFLDVQSKYERAANALIRQPPPYQIEELRALEMKIVTNSYLYRERLRFKFASDRFGARALERLHAYDRLTGEPPLAQAESLARLADWNILYASNTDKTGWSPANDNPAQALAMYEQAYALLEQAGAERASFDEVFAPAVPIVLPTFVPNPLVSEPPAQGSAGFIDVAFDITKFGRSATIEVLDTSTNATRSAKSDLTRLIATSRFRPRATSGRFPDTSHVVVRYYLRNPLAVAEAPSSSRAE